MTKEYNKVKQVEQNIKEVEEVVDEGKRPELKPIVSAAPAKVKRGLAGRFVRGLLGPEGAAGIGEYVAEEIVKPAIKNIIVDAVTSGINMIMFGEKTNPRARNTNYSRSYGPGAPRTNYTSRYTSQNAEPARKEPVRSNRYGVDEYVIQDRYEASNVLATITEHADRYGSVSVADFYELIGVESQYTDHQYGWTIDSIVSATVVPVRGGYTIRLPRVEVI